MFIHSMTKQMAGRRARTTRDRNESPRWHAVSSCGPPVTIRWDGRGRLAGAAERAVPAAVTRRSAAGDPRATWAPAAERNPGRLGSATGPPWCRGAARGAAGRRSGRHPAAPTPAGYPTGMCAGTRATRKHRVARRSRCGSTDAAPPGQRFGRAAMRFAVRGAGEPTRCAAQRGEQARGAGVMSRGDGGATTRQHGDGAVPPRRRRGPPGPREGHDDHDSPSVLARRGPPGPRAGAPGIRG